MNERTKLLECLSAADFAAWEMHLFLDTHPNNSQAIEAGKEYSRRAAVLRKEYETRYGSLTANFDDDDNKWTWICDPWPWDYVKGE